MEIVNLIIDTDIGPDCDDAGALACAHTLQSEGLCRILAVTHCTSNPYGAGCADAINCWYGRGDIPVGTLKENGFLSEPEYMRYNRYIAQNYPNRYPAGEGVPDAVTVLREALASLDDGGAVICAIGPLVNLSNLLHSLPEGCSPLGGLELVARKVKRLIVMGGGWTGPEWNFQMRPAAAMDVCANWPTEVWFSTFDVGETIITGRDWQGEDGSNPIRDAYRLYSPDGRMSWDQTAVYAAVMGPGQFFSLSEAGGVVVAEDGLNSWYPAVGGRHRYLIKTVDDREIANDIDERMRRGRSC